MFISIPLIMFNSYLLLFIFSFRIIVSLVFIHLVLHKFLIIFFPWRLSGNPVCKNSNIQRIGQYCALERDELDEEFANSTTVCHKQSCPVDNFFEYAPKSPIPCFCAAPLRIGYRLKSPSFSYFPPYITHFETYITDSLNLSFYQLSIDSYDWEEGPRLRIYLKLFPSYNDSHSNTFNTSEVRRILSIFTSWRFPRTDLFGPYELLNVTLLGPYANSKFLNLNITQHFMPPWLYYYLGSQKINVNVEIVLH